jgi:Tfp pilus assembly protein PilF
MTHKITPSEENSYYTLNGTKDSLLDSFASFLETISVYQTEGERCCFFLGAGASVESGIPSAYSLIRMWDSEIESYHNEYSDRYKAWKLSNNITHDNIANYYSQCYEWRFPEEREGHIYLQKVIRAAFPSRGYGMLANILSNSDNNVIITTNFDQLIQREISKLNKDCIILSHESILHQALSSDLTTANVPVVIKLHRDLYLNPLNRENELKTLYGGWEALLANVFSKYHVIFCGYAGNDPNVFSFLKQNSSKFSDGSFKSPFWLIYDSPNDTTVFHNEYKKLCEFFITANCRIVAHEGFDWTISKIFECITGVPSINWKPTVAEMLTDINKVTYPRQRELLDQCLKIYKNDYIALEYYASIEAENEHFDEADRLYSLALESNPFSNNILNNYALYLDKSGKNMAKVQELYLRGINMSPNDYVILGNYAEFLERRLSDYDGAEKYYNLALACNENDEILPLNYADFLVTKYKSTEKAESFFINILNSHPDYYYVVGCYAFFSHMVLNDYVLAEDLYKQYLEMDMTSATILAHYARFLDAVKGNQKQAIKYYKLALKVDNEYSFALCNLAILLNVKGDIIQAEKMYKRAIKFEPHASQWHWNYAIFLEEKKGNSIEAQYHFLRALELDPDDLDIQDGCREFKNMHPELFQSL